MKISSTCVQTLKSSWSSITTNSGYTQRWVTVLRKSLNDKPSAKVRPQIPRLRRSLSSLAWLNLRQGCWSRGLKRRPLLQTSSPLEKASRRLHERTNVPMTNCLNSGVHLTENCRCANLVCLNRGVHPTRVCRKCAVRFEPICAKMPFFDTFAKASVRAYLRGKCLILIWLPPRDSNPDMLIQSQCYADSEFPGFCLKNQLLTSRISPHGSALAK